MFKFFKKKKSITPQPTVTAETETKEKRLKIAYTVYPDEKLEYNEFWQRIYEENKQI